MTPDPARRAARVEEEERDVLARLVYVSECAHLGIMAWPEQPKEPSLYHRLADSVLEHYAQRDAALARDYVLTVREYEVRGDGV